MSRAGLLEMAGRSDPLIRDALETVLDRGDFIPTLTGPALFDFLLEAFQSHK